MYAEYKQEIRGCGLTLALILGGALVYGVISFFDLASSRQGSQEDNRAQENVVLSKIKPRVRKTKTDGKVIHIPKLATHLDADKKGNGVAKAGGFSAAMGELGPVVDDAQDSDEAIQAQSVLDATPMCWHGHAAQRVPSLYTRRGFAITYGAENYNTGDPRPRLEIFFNGQPPDTFASYLSMTHETIQGFENDQEVAIPRTESVITTLIARWVAAMADGICPSLKK